MVFRWTTTVACPIKCFFRRSAKYHAIKFLVCRQITTIPVSLASIMGIPMQISLWNSIGRICYYNPFLASWSTFPLHAIPGCAEYHFVHQIAVSIVYLVHTANFMSQFLFVMIGRFDIVFWSVIRTTLNDQIPPVTMTSWIKRKKMKGLEGIERRIMKAHGTWLRFHYSIFKNLHY